MPRLLHDRYVTVDQNRACDLLTGEYTRIEDVPDDPDEGGPPLGPLIEVLEHGRDGDPRWLVADVRNGMQAAALTRRAGHDARRHGFVAMSVDAYHRYRATLLDDLRERTLLLIGGFAAAVPAARRALLDVSALSPRPHLLLTFRSSEEGSASFAREARVAYAGMARADRMPSPPPVPDLERQIARMRMARENVTAGRHAAAERVFRDVAAALERREARGAAADVLLALGRLLLERGRAEPADQVFDRSAQLAGMAKHDEAVFEARLWQAAARTDAGRLTDAEAISRAVLAAGAGSPTRQSHAEAALARVLLWQGRAAEASRLSLAPVDAAICGAATGAWIDSVAVRVWLACGQVFDAGQRARAALATAEATADLLARVIAHTAHLRVLAAAGDLVLAEQRLRDVVALARQAHTPLRAVRARLVWADAMRRAGRSPEARRAGALKRLQTVSPPLLRRAIEHGASVAACQAPAPHREALPSTAVELVRLANDEEQDETAVRRILERLFRHLRASRTELLSADAGPVSTIMSVGAGMMTRLGTRVLEAGIAIGPETRDGGHEVGVPVRLGSRLLAALVCRWPSDRMPPPDAHAMLELGAAVSAPRIDGFTSHARETARAATSVPELIGISASIGELRKAIARAAAAPFAVLIEGESGVGKELVARAIHQLGPRRERRFCDVNCAALPEELLESELFGHARGAFTGAVADRAGLFEEADGGTLFLDELADMSPRGQAKLLRVLQQHEVRRVGETFSRRVDVRVVTAANRDMRAEAADGRFRRDLLYRLDVIRVRIPPLRERPEDIPVLARHFWQGAAARLGTSARLSHAVLAALARYHWPGNVRELQNAMAALAVAAPKHGQVRSALLPGAIGGAGLLSSSGRLSDARAEFERRFVEAAVARAGGNVSRAAGELGVSRQGLAKILARLKLFGSDPRETLTAADQCRDATPKEP